MGLFVFGSMGASGHPLDLWLESHSLNILLHNIHIGSQDGPYPHLMVSLVMKIFQTKVQYKVQE
jgi:hypothetical protein